MPAKSKPVNSQKQLIMNIAIIGYGRMGHEIESVAVQRAHKIKLIVDQENSADLNEDNLKEIDVAIEFSSPGSAFNNIVKCFSNKVPVVSGTTGWLEDYDKAAGICTRNKVSFIHSSNFSIGVNLLFMLSRELAKKIKMYPDYTVSIEEIHHVKKLDAPSGTAITLAEGIVSQHPAYENWCFENEKLNNCIPIRSVREGVVPGTHVVSWDSSIDSISLKHETKNRKGLALGAVVAAEFIYQKEGIFTMNNVLGF